MTPRPLLAVCCLVTAAALLTPVPAAAAPHDESVAADPTAADLPEGWSVRWTRSGPLLSWRSPQRLPWGAARLQVRQGEAVLADATLRTDQRTVVARVSPEQLEAISAGGSSPLKVWSGGTQLTTGETSGTVVGERAAPLTSPVLSVQDDPGQPGPADVDVSSYRLPRRSVGDLAEPVEMLAQVVAPAASSEPRPLVLFLHGRHETCYRPDNGRVSVAWPCPDDTKPVPSYQGYGYLQRHLASRGFVSASISANGVNAQDVLADDGGTAARSALVREHLGLWSQWAEPGGLWEGKVDLEHVLLVGHSRGGEGVQRAVIDSEPDDPWHIDASVLLAPTAALRQTPAFTPTTTLLPSCDGDVGSWDGQVYVDRPRDVTSDPALRSAVAVVGANHNFFNTEWTPATAVAKAVDDAARRPECRPDSTTRLTASEQRRAAKTYVAAAADALLLGSPSALKLLDGTNVSAPTIADLDIRAAALGGRRTTVRPGLDGRVVGTAGAVLCEGRSGGGRTSCGRGRDAAMTPHWPGVWLGSTVPTAPAMELAWTDRAGRALVALKRSIDLTAARAVEARVAVDPEQGASTLALRLVDSAGRVMTLDAPRLQPLPGGSNGAQIWGQTLRASLPRDIGRFDLGDVTQIGVVARSSSGHVWVLDVSGYRPGLAPLPETPLPRLDVATVEAVEGDAANAVVRLPLRLDSPSSETVVAAVEVLSWDGATTVSRVRFEPGEVRQVLRFAYEGDTRDDFDRRAWSVTAFALKNVVVREPLGRAVVVDDDPAPTVAVVPVADDVAEGETLRWRVELSAPADYGFVVIASAAPDALTRPELYSDDVSRRWLRQQAPVPDVPAPLHEIGLQLVAFLPEGTTSAELRVPTVSDGVDEGSEWLTFVFTNESGDTVAAPVSGRVTD